jgi:hypothetical protein
MFDHVDWQEEKYRLEGKCSNIVNKEVCVEMFIYQKAFFISVIKGTNLAPV